MRSLPFGTILNSRYQVLRQLGQGGMSTVFYVQDLQLGKHWALKILDGTGVPDQSGQDLPEEVQILMALDHPLAPRMVDRFELDGSICIVMDHISGISLQQALDKDGPMAPHRAAACMKDICSLLSHLHQSGIVYRDLKPANLILSPSGRVRLVDFGYPTKLVKDEGYRDPVPFGTRGYAAPEQFKGLSDPRSDVYAAGITLYQLLTADSPVRKGFKLRPAMVLKPGIPAGLGRIILKATQEKPKNRFRTMEELADALENYQKLDLPHLEKLKRKLALSKGLLAAGLACTLAGGLLFEAFYLRDFADYRRLVQTSEILAEPSEEDLLQAARLLPARPEALLQLARLYRDQGFPKEKLELFESLLERCSKASFSKGAKISDIAFQGACSYLCAASDQELINIGRRAQPVKDLLIAAAGAGDHSQEAAGLLAFAECAGKETLSAADAQRLKESLPALLSGAARRIGKGSARLTLVQDLLICQVLTGRSPDLDPKIITGKFLKESALSLDASLERITSSEPKPGLLLLQESIEELKKLAEGRF